VAPLRNLEGASFTAGSSETDKIGLQKRSLSLYESSAKGTWGGGGAPFPGNPEGYVKEGSGNRHLSPYGPH